ncbi:MAG TPA: D-alanyl-D-alanine carboxypeptidase family protein [Xanthobacteraceae bacterium]|nr:D-alanyl-D-alanine carboxypeptidase family protein [Xanthobacteraceae bacterium]
MSPSVKWVAQAFAQVFLATLAAAVLVAPARASNNEAVLLIDAATGKVLQAENATVPWHPASLSKLMTTYVTLQAVKDGRISFDTLLTVSPAAAAQTPSKMGFRPGIQVTVDNALKMLLVHSANDIAWVLAEGIDGSIDKFAEEMNATSQRLGMTQSSWVNPNGLPDDRQISSARDMGILARALMHDFPEYDFYWHIPAIKFGKRVMRNYNKLLADYPGADGMKTGFICASGFNLVASATRGDRRLIAIVLGAPSSAVRTVKAATLLERGFNSSMLSWLLPSLGTVDALKPVNVDPPDLHDTICGPHRKRPAAEDEDDEAGTTTAGDSGDQQHAFMLSDLKDSQRGSLLTGNPLAAVPPIVVYVGPKRATAVATAADDAAIPTPAKPHKKRTKAAATEKDKDKQAAAKPADAKTGDAKAKAAEAKPKTGAAKTAQAKPTAAKPKAAPPPAQ